ncbi:MAG: sigma-70 family RNA polymerase sigma factor [Planctomycetaceae bacterium]|nr:sigma-70 family RNA polymerase sigma factor [Planctomycetaceae bacterium]
MYDRFSFTLTAHLPSTQDRGSNIYQFLQQACRRQLACFPDVRRWEQTDDIFQQSVMKLVRAVGASPPQSRRHLENLAALQVRRTLIDLARRYAASLTMNRDHWTPGCRRCDVHATESAVDSSAETSPESLLEWSELHEQVDQLPPEDREVFQLIWYRGMDKPAVAELLSVDLRTIQRRWRSARQMLTGRLVRMPSL